MESPPIDRRTYAQLVAETEAQAREISAWRPGPAGSLDAGGALIRIFGHFASLVVERLNRAPARNQLAFLNLIGTTRLPPQPARVPLTFTLAARSPVDALVPAGTLVGAPPPQGETDDVVFETERDLVVTRSTIAAVYVSDTESDTFSERTAAATGAVGEPFAAFGGNTPSPHHLYVGVEPRADASDVTIELRSPDMWHWANWPIVWEHWDGAAWRRVPHTSSHPPGAWLVGLGGVTSLPAYTVDGVEAGWIRARLELPLPPGETGNVPEWVALGNRNPQRLTPGLSAFGETGQRLYICADEPFAAGGAHVRLQFRLAPAGSSSNAGLTWAYHDGTDWRTVGQSSARAEQSGANTFEFVDGTNAMTRDGEVTFHVPLGWPRTRHRTRTGRWLRVDVSGGTYRRAPEIAAIELAHDWELPHVSAVVVDGRAPLAMRSYNDFTYRDDVTTPFAPTADEDPALYLGFDQPFPARPMAVYLRIEPPRPEQVAADELAHFDPANHAVLLWEYDAPDGWRPLGAVDETQALSTSGLVSFGGPPDLTTRRRLGHDCSWVRARWVRGAFPLPPRLRSVLLNTMSAIEAVTVRDAILGSSNGNPGQAFTTARSPVQDGERLAVRERDELAGGPDAGPTWVMWEARPDLYESGGRDRHYTIDRHTGEIRFGDGVFGMIPPIGPSNIRITYRTGGGERGNCAAGTIVELKTAVPYVDRVVNHEPAQGGAAAEPIERVVARGPRVIRHGGRAITADDLVEIATASPAVARAHAVVPTFNPSGLWLAQSAPPSDDHVEADAGRMGVVVVPNDDTDRPTPTVGLVRAVHADLRARCPVGADLWVAGPEWIVARVRAVVSPATLVDVDALGTRVGSAIERFLHPLTGGSDGQGWAFGRKPHPSALLAVAARVDGVDHVASLEVSLEPETDDPDRKVALQRLLNRPLGGRTGPPPLERELQRWLDRALVCSGRHEIRVVL